MKDVSVMGIEHIRDKSSDSAVDAYIYHLVEWIENGEGCRALGRVYTRNVFNDVNVGDEVIPEFAQSRNGWYIKSLKKKGDNE